MDPSLKRFVIYVAGPTPGIRTAATAVAALVELDAMIDDGGWTDRIIDQETGETLTIQELEQRAQSEGNSSA